MIYSVEIITALLLLSILAYPPLLGRINYKDFLTTPSYALALLLIVLAYFKTCVSYRSMKKLIVPAVASRIIYRYMSSDVSTSYLGQIMEIIDSCTCNKTKLVIGDLAGVILVFYAVISIAKIMRTDVMNFHNQVIDFGYSQIKDLSIVKNEVVKEQNKLEEDLNHSMKASSRMGMQCGSLPEKGLSRKYVLDLMKKATSTEDAKWIDGKMSGGVYSGDPKHQEFLNEAFGMYSLSNPLHADCWPSAMKFESEIISMTASLMNNDGRVPTVCGAVTSGGTESILLAHKAHRDFYYDKYGITDGEVIACVTAHAACDKACDTLGLKKVSVNYIQNTFQVDVSEVERSIGPNTILIYASAPTFPQGVIDNIEALSALAVKYNVGLHVDMCLGGFFLPFMRKLGYEVPEFDFRLPGVTSMSCDTHKYGYALKGTSVVLYRNKELRHAQYFCYPEWTGGLYSTPTMAGSRSGGMVAQTWASLVTVGMEGFLKNTKDIVECLRYLGKAIDNIPGLKTIGGYNTMVLCFISTDPAVNIYTINDKMSKKGWSLSSLQNPASVHVTITMRQVGKEKILLADLMDCIEDIRNHPEDKQSGTAAIYGTTATLPPGPIVEIMKTYNDVVYQL